MIVGKHDVYYTVAELASMLGRSPKTIENWASEGKIRFSHLCGTPLIRLSMVENLITGYAPPGVEKGKLAARLTNQTDRLGRRRGQQTAASAGGQDAVAQVAP